METGLKNQQIHQMNKEHAILAAFRQMNDECQADALTMMQAMADSFPRRAPVALRLLTAGVAGEILGQGAGDD